MALAWEEPPVNRSSTWLEEASQLRACPGQWAVICIKPHSRAAVAMASHISNGNLAAFRPAGTFEATSRTVDGEARVYARYVGSEEQG